MLVSSRPSSLSTTLQVPGTMASTDRDVLVVLFRSTSGGGWIRKDKWDTDDELSTWHGVSVNREGRVVKIQLNNHKLRGRSFPRRYLTHAIC